MYAKLRLLGHIQEKQKHNLFFEGQDQGTGPCPEEQQGAAYIGTLACPRYLPGVMASLACSFRNSAMSCETDFVSIAISLCASGEVYGFISL